MRIGTWNVEYAYPARMQRLKSYLNNKIADIWVLTETHGDLRPFGCPFAVHADPRPVNWSGIREGSRWVSVWTSFPVIEQIMLDGADHKRTVCARLDVGNEKDLIVYGTVLPWCSDAGSHPKETAPPLWSEHHRIIPQQVEEWKELRRRYPESDLCIAGDFNTDMLDGDRYGTPLGIGLLRNGLRECGMYCATEPTRVGDKLLPILPIDHIALPSLWSSKIVDAWPVQKSVLSDHSGLIVEVNLSHRRG